MYGSMVPSEKGGITRVSRCLTRRERISCREINRNAFGINFALFAVAVLGKLTNGFYKVSEWLTGENFRKCGSTSFGATLCGIIFR